MGSKVDGEGKGLYCRVDGEFNGVYATRCAAAELKDSDGVCLSPVAILNLSISCFRASFRAVHNQS